MGLNELKEDRMEQEKKKILLVEENSWYRRLYQETFRRYAADEFSLIHEPGLQGALERLSGERVDAVLLDLTLSEASVLENMTRAQAADSTAPIVALSGYSHDKLSFYAPQWAPVVISPKNLWRGETLVSALRYYTNPK
jgi:CheY-like chemotaxis protein